MILQLPEIVNETVGQGTFSKSWQFSFFVRSLIRGQMSVNTRGGAVIGRKQISWMRKWGQMGSKWFNEYMNPVLDYNVDLTGATCICFFVLLQRSTPNWVAWNNRNEWITTEPAPWSSYSPALTQFCWIIVWIPEVNRATLSLKTLKENPSIPFSQLLVWLAILSSLTS